MEFIFDTLALASENSSQDLLSSLSIPDFLTLNQWWNSLTISEQSQIYRIETPEILNDLHESLTAAFLLFNLDSEYSEHAPIKWLEKKDNFEFVISRTYEFEFFDCDLLQPKLCQLFSHFLFSFLLEPALCHPLPQDDCPTCSAKSFITIKKDSLNLFFNLLESSSSDFLSPKILFSKDHSLDFYLAFTQQSFLRQYFSDIKSFSIQDLLHKLIAISILFQNNLYLFYAEKTNQVPLPKSLKTNQYLNQHMLVDYLVHNRPQSPSTDTLLIPDKIGGCLQTMSTSTSASNLSGNSGSAKDNFNLNSKPFVPGNNISGNLLELVVDKPELMNEDVVDVNREGKEEQEEDYMHETYEGFFIGNLEIEFTAQDPFYLIPSENESEVSERYRPSGSSYYERYNKRGGGYKSQTYYTPRNNQGYQTEYRNSPRNNQQYKENYDTYNRPKYYNNSNRQKENKFFPAKRASYIQTNTSVSGNEIDYVQLILNHGQNLKKNIEENVGEREIFQTKRGEDRLEESQKERV